MLETLATQAARNSRCTGGGVDSCAVVRLGRRRHAHSVVVRSGAHPGAVILSEARDPERSEGEQAKSKDLRAVHTSLRPRQVERADSTEVLRLRALRALRSG